MCQLCAIKDIAARDRWPKDMEYHKGDIKFLVESAHDEYSTSRPKTDKDASQTTTQAVKASEALLELLRLLATLLSEVESDREKWWTSPHKREQRKNLELECNQKKLSNLHKINNTVSECIESISARPGMFVKWSLGMNGGVWEVEASAKVEDAPASAIKAE